MNYSSKPTDHRSMVFDKIRNNAYFKAIAAAVDNTSRVLDLGAGVGVLGLEAARLGAQQVVFIDSSAVVRTVAEIAKDNGLEDRVEILQTPLEQVRLSEQVDLILSVFTGNFLLEEDLLPLLFQARDRHLAPGGKLVPDRAKMYVAPICAADYYTKHIDCWGATTSGIDYAAGREFAVNTAYYDSAESFDARLLSEPVCLTELDFTTATRAECKASVDLLFNTTGTCHGFLGWFDMRLGQEWLSTSPLSSATHWSQVFFPFREPLEVSQGEQATLRVLRPQHGQWSWIVQRGDERQAHSTAMGTPLAHSDFDKRTETAQPLLNDRGRAIRAGLQAMDGETTIKTIAGNLMESYPSAFASEEDAISALTGLAWKHSSS